MSPVADQAVVEEGLTSTAVQEAEALFKEAKGRERRRRAAIVAISVFVAVVVSLLIEIAINRNSPTVKPGSPFVGASRPVAYPIPETYIAHTPTKTASPGSIEVVSVTTGQIVRTLGSAYDPYLMNGFQVSPGGAVLYYTRLNQPAQTIEITAVPVQGGTATVIADGTDPAVSANGRSIAFVPSGVRHAVTVMNLKTRRSVTLDPPTTDQSQTMFSMSWLPGSKRLLVTVGTPPASCDDAPNPPGIRIQCNAPPPAAPKTFAVAIADPTHWSLIPAPSRIAGGWRNLTLEGPGPIGGTVLVLAEPPTTDVQVISIEQALTGRILHSYRLPAGTTFLASDRSRSHFLIASANGTEAWTPTEGALRLIGPIASEASW